MRRSKPVHDTSCSRRFAGHATSHRRRRGFDFGKPHQDSLPLARSSLRAGDEVVELGDRVLLPGLVNAHCHLDYTDLAGEIPATRLFTDWIKSITTAKAGRIYADFAQSWLRGAQMLLRTGTTTVADIESVPELLPEVWLATPLRVFSFLELTGVKSRREPRCILEDAVLKIQSLPASRGGAGLSPHAPYSTMPELLRLSSAAAREKGWRLVTHVAESDQEFEMFQHARGAMFDWLQRNRTQHVRLWPGFARATPRAPWLPG
jgi:cytosine/adenosine deaminase-related metal-dependent hydrolase